jgi:DNA-binding response OmpR family regulator
MDVLLVEDEPLVRELLAEDMAEAGLDVAKAPSAEAALGAAAGEAGRPLCVLVTDVDLGGGMDGLALAREVRRRWPGVGVVYVTGRPSSLDGHALGARERFLPKPFALPRLTAAVRDLMGRSRR